MREGGLARVWRFTVRIAAVLLFAMGLAPRGITAQDSATQNAHRRYPHYKLFVVGTFGGFGSYLGFGPSRVLTGNGTLVGFADTNIDETLVDALCAPDICDIQRSFT